MENLVIEHCQIDNNSGDGILYEDWAIHTTARHNVDPRHGDRRDLDRQRQHGHLRGQLPRSEQRGRLALRRGEQQPVLSDFLAIRNNIIVHNDYALRRH